MIAVKVNGDFVRNKRGKVKIYGTVKDVHMFYRCWDETKLKSVYDVEIINVSKKELRKANG